MMTEINEMKQKDLVLVTGGTGKTGRRVVELLQEMNVPVRAGSRSGNPPFDWMDENTWAPALENAGSVYLVFYPDLAVPGAPEAIQTFTELAARSGVQKIVLLSGRGEEEARKCEQIVQNSGIDWTILRASWFNQNFSEGAFLEQIMSGQIALPVGDVREPFIDVDDIAGAAVAALTQEGHSNRLYEMTGPDLLTFAEAIAEVAEAIGREIEYKEISADDFTAGLREQGMPEGEIGLLNYLFTNVLDGRNSYLADGVQRALGREPGSFKDYVQKAKAAWAKEVGHHG